MNLKTNIILSITLFYYPMHPMIYKLVMVTIILIEIKIFLHIFTVELRLIILI